MDKGLAEEGGPPPPLRKTPKLRYQDLKGDDFKQQFRMYSS